MTATAKKAVNVNPNEFMGYPTELLRGYKGMGPALIGDDKLHEAVVKYHESQAPDGSGSVLGPALLTKDATQVVQSITTAKVPDGVGQKPVPKESKVEGWDAYDLHALIALAEAKGVKIDGRVKTPGKLIAALDAAGVQP